MRFFKWFTTCFSGQFRLRSLFALTTIVAVILGVQARRREHERCLLEIIETYNLAMDEHRYGDAVRIAEAAVDEYPREDVVRYIAKQQENWSGRSTGWTAQRLAPVQYSKDQ